MLYRGKWHFILFWKSSQQWNYLFLWSHYKASINPTLWGGGGGGAPISDNMVCSMISKNEHMTYEGCSYMDASSFITFFTYMLRQNVITFWKELFVFFKMAPNIKKHSLYFFSNGPYIKGIPVHWRFSEANCNTRFGTCADIVSYLCKF